MNKYRKKPVVIEAVRFTGGNWEEIKEFTNGSARNFSIEKRIDGECFCEIETLEGTMRANDGDFIIKGVNNEFYPCKPDIFEMTYEQVN